MAVSIASPSDDGAVGLDDKGEAGARGDVADLWSGLSRGRGGRQQRDGNDEWRQLDAGILRISCRISSRDRTQHLRHQRLRPGIPYFVSGGGGKLRRGDVAGGEISAKAFDQGYHFMLIEIVGDRMHFQVLNEAGKTVDNGAISRPDLATAPLGQ